VRILVTGGAGFIGSHVVDAYVARGDEVTVFDDLSSGRRDWVHRAARLIEGDLADAAAVERAVAEARPDLVNHHAAQIDVRRSVSDPALDARVNVLGGIHLLDACVRHRVGKVIYASTGGAIYGEAERLPASEDHPVRPEAPYGLSKLTLERYLEQYRRLHGLRSTVLRYPNVYGPRQNPHGEAGVNAIFIGLMLAGKRPTIYGDGEQLRDYLYVDDVVDANLRAVDRADGGTLNLGTGVGTSVRDIVTAINAILGTSLEPVFEAARPGEVRRITLDATRARAALGWAPRTAFMDGVRRTIAWFRDPAAVGV
jgi:UDP-glucose 4-epimerase